MTLHRTKPDFDTKSIRESVAGGVFLAFVSLVLGLGFAISLLVTGIKNRQLWSVLVGLFMIPVLVFQGVMAINMALDGVSQLTQWNRWISGTAQTHAKVLEKKEDSFDGSYDEGTCYTYEFALDVTPLMTADDLDEQFVWASVSKRIYDRYAAGDMVLVHYLAASPLTFMIEGE